MNKGRKYAVTALAICMAFTCAACGGGATHDLEYVERVEPTCTQDGSAAYWRCKDCGLTFLDGNASAPAGDTLLPALDHNFDETEYRFNCLFGGELVRICSRCGEGESEELPALERHTWNNENVCTVCGYEYIPTLGLEYFLIVENSEAVGYAVSGGISTGANVVIPCFYNKLPVIEIAAGAFQGREDLTGFVCYADLRAINSSAFEGCTGLKEIKLSKSLISVGQRAFRSCYQLKSISIPDGVTVIGAEAFYGCSELETLEIGAGLTSIGRSAFWNCGALKSITVSAANKRYSGEGNCLIERETGLLIRGCGSSAIPSTVQEIGEYAFFSCEELTKITIPVSVKKIGAAAFRDCGNLQEIVYAGTQEEWAAVEKGKEWITNTKAEIKFIQR